MHGDINGSDRVDVVIRIARVWWSVWYQGLTAAGWPSWLGRNI